MPRFQFSLRDLFWLVLVIAGFLGGMAIQKRLDEPTIMDRSVRVVPDHPVRTEAIELRGQTWIRMLKADEEY